MTRAAALLVAILWTVSAIAGEVAPTSPVVGGLLRGPSLGVSFQSPQGSAAIETVFPGSAAEKMGLRPGDVILSVDGAAIADAAPFLAAIGRKHAGDPLAIVARRGEETVTLQGTLGARPLEQQADYAIEYGSVDVAGAKRRVIVTRPRGEGKHPAVLLIGGIGCYSLDGILRPPELRDAYAKVLDALTRAGYVTMRVEKSGIGDSEGPRCDDPKVDFDAEVRGNAAGLAQLESMEFVDRRNVFLFAHSIGPLVAARIASERPVRGIVVAETVGTSWLEYDLTNVRRQLLLSGMPYDEVDAAVRHHEVCAHRFFIERQKPEQILAADASCADDLHAPAPYTYMHQLGSLDLAPLWKKIEAPVLIFYGTADFVTDDFQHEYLRDMINSFHPGRATYVEIDGMDHGLLLAGTQRASMERGETPPPFAQRVVEETLRFFNGAKA